MSVNNKMNSDLYTKGKQNQSNKNDKLKRPPMISQFEGSSSSDSSELGVVAQSAVFTVPQEHGRPKAKIYADTLISPTCSLLQVTASISLTSISSSIERSSSRFRSDFNDFKCKMKIFGESLNLCKCIASDFKNKMKWMEKRLDNLEKRHRLTKQESNYSSIINKNRMLSQKCLNDAKKLQMCGTEEEMREIAGKICRNYLHGAWKKVDPHDMYFSRVSGGLSNFLYLVGLPEGRKTNTTYQMARESSPEDEDSSDKLDFKTSFVMEEPQKVLLRIYGQVHGERAMDAIVTESVIFTLLSERKLGPKLYGVFSGGRIEEFIPARPLLTKELADPAISMKIAEKMAAIHSLELPLSKDPDWFWKNCYKWLKTIKEDHTQGRQKGRNPQEERIIKGLTAVDFDKELKWMQKFLSTVDSPVVFCHNDMQEGNILMFEEGPGNMADDTCEGVDDGHKDLSSFEDANTSDSILSRMSDSGEPKMMFIDYEYCAYNYRGFDMANHFQEWAIDYSNPEHPFYYFNEEDFPTLEQKEIFIKEYLKHYNSNSSDAKDLNPPTVDQVNQLLYEVEAFSLSSNLLWTLWSCVNAPKSQIPFGYWEYAQTRLDTYYRLKAEIIKKGNGVAQKRKICEVDI